MDASQQIDKRIQELDDWRGQVMARIRRLVLTAAPHLVEEWKWDTPVWSSNGNVLAVGSFRDHLKINFFRGALLEDPKRLFNAGLEAKTTRAIDIYEKDKWNESAFQDLVRAAVALNDVKSKPAAKKKSTGK